LVGGVFGKIDATRQPHKKLF